MLKLTMPLTLALLIMFATLAVAADVHVRGYTRRDGTYVQPHVRTAPDGNPYNNYSSPGNYNPNRSGNSMQSPSGYGSQSNSYGGSGNSYGGGGGSLLNPGNQRIGGSLLD